MSNVTAIILSCIGAILTAMLLNFALSPGPRSGPDSAGTEIFYLLICPVRFTAIATLIGLALRRGGFGFLATRFEVQAAAVFVPLLICGVLSLASFMSVRLGGKLELIGVYVFGAAVPVLWILLGLITSSQNSASLRPLTALIGIILGMLTLTGAIAGIVRYQRVSTVNAERRRQNVEEQRRADDIAERQLADERRGRLRELHTLPTDGPIGPWIKAAFDSDADVRTEAESAMKSRPTLQIELAELLVSDARAQALKYLWWKNPPAGPEVQQAFMNMLKTMPEWSQKRLSNPTEANPTEVAGAAEAVVVLVERIPNDRNESRGLIKKWVDFLQQNFNVTEFRGYQLLTQWLANNPEKK